VESYSNTATLPKPGTSYPSRTLKTTLCFKENRYSKIKGVYIMSTVSSHRYFLTMLIWALLLEIIIFAYYVPRGEFGVEFTLTFVVFLITVTSIVLTIRKIRQEI